MEKRNYWLKLQEDFFATGEARYLKRQGQYQTIVFLLEIALKTINTEGELYLQVGKKKMGYTLKEIATDANMSVNFVKKSLKILAELDLIELRNDGIIFVKFVPNSIGSESASAERVRKYRENQKEKPLHCNKIVTTDTDIDTDTDSSSDATTQKPEAEKPAEPKEKETTITTEIKKESETETSIEDGKDTANSKPEESETDNKNDLVGMILSAGKELGEYKDVAERIASEYGEMNPMLIFRAIKKAKEAEKPSWRYAIKILQNWKSAGITTLEQQETDQKQHDRRNQYSKTRTATSAPKWSNSNELYKQAPEYNAPIYNPGACSGYVLPGEPLQDGQPA